MWIMGGISKLYDDVQYRNAIFEQIIPWIQSKSTQTYARLVNLKFTVFAYQFGCQIVLLYLNRFENTDRWLNQSFCSGIITYM